MITRGQAYRENSGSGAYDKTPVFGIRQRGVEVYTEIMPEFARKNLQAIIGDGVDPDSIIHSDPWHGHIGQVEHKNINLL